LGLALSPAVAQSRTADLWSTAAWNANRWSGYADVVIRPTSNKNQSAAGFEFFVPVAQAPDALVFIDANLSSTFDAEFFGNLGAGFRKIIHPDVILGANVFFDHTPSPSGKVFYGATIGGELLTETFDARVNLHVPFKTSQQVGQIAGAPTSSVALSGNQLIELISTPILRFDEFAYYGVDGEVGAKLPVALPNGSEIRGFAGGYHYWSSGNPDITGVTGRLEYRAYDVFGERLPDTRLILGVGASHDDVRGTRWFGEARLRMPLGDVKTLAPTRLSALDRRMTEHIRPSATRIEKRASLGTPQTSSSVVTDPLTGRPYSSIYFANGANTVRDGTQAAPTTLNDAVARAGVNGIVVAEGNAGIITTPGATLQNGQSLLGGGTSVPIRLSNGTTTTFTLGSVAGVIQGTTAANVITLGNANIVANITTTGGSSGIFGNAISGGSLQNVSVGNTSGAGISLQGIGGTFQITGGAINGTGGAGISAGNVAALAITGTTFGATAPIAGNALQVVNSGGANTLALNNLVVAGAGGAGVSVDGSAGGSTTLTSFANNTIANAGGGGALFNGVLFDADPAAPGIQQVAAGNLGITNVTGNGLWLNNVAGSLGFQTLTIGNSGGTGLYVRNTPGQDFALASTGGSIATTGGTAVDLDPVTVNMILSSVTASGGVNGLLFDQVAGSFQVTGTTSVSNTTGSGIEIRNSSAAFNFGTTSVNTSGGSGIALTGNTGNVAFGATSVASTAGDGIALTTNSGSVAFGNTSISNPGVAGIDIEGSNAPISFGDVSITGLGGGTGVDLRDGATPTQAQVTFGSLTISGTGVAGSRGIDYRGTTNTRDVVTLRPSFISGVDIGVDLGNAAATGLFQFGDGSNTDANGAASTISATTPLVVAGLNPGVGTYNFRDVNLVGNTSNLSTTVYFVDNVTDGTDNGTSAHPGTLAGAIASAASVIALVDTQPGGAADIIDAASALQGAVNTLTLLGGQQLVGFANGDSVTVNAAVTPNLQLFGVTAAIANPNPGSGAPVLTTTDPGSNTVTLGNGNLLNGIVVTNGGAATAVSGAGINGVEIRGSQVATLALSNASGTATLTNSAFSALALNGGSIGINATGTTIDHSTAGAALSVSGGHTGTVVFDSTSVIVATAGSGLQFDNADGSYSFNGSTQLDGGDAAIDIVNGSSGTFSFGAGTSIISPTGTAFNIAASTASVTYSGNISQSNNAAAVSIFDHAFGTVVFDGTIAASNGSGLQFSNANGSYNFNGTTALNGGDAGIDIAGGSAGTFSFGPNTSINSPTGAAFNIASSTASVTYSGNITQASNAAAVAVTDHSGGTVTFQSGTISASNGPGLQFSNASGSYNFNGTTTLNGGDAGIDILNGSAGVFAFGAGTAITSPSGTAFNVDTSTAQISYAGSITQNNAAGAVAINALTGGFASFSGPVNASTGSATAVNLTNNTGGTVSFGGGLAIATTTATGFNASGGGTISVTGAGNTLAASAGKAIDLDGITANVNFATTSSTGSAGNGVSIANMAGTVSLGDTTVTNAGSDGVLLTGNSGTVNFATLTIAGPAGDGLRVAGGGAVNVTGATTISNPAGDGIDLTAATNPTLSFAGIDITGLGAGTGLNLAGGDATFTATSLNTTGTNNPASRGIDLSGTTGNRVVTIVNGGTISGVGTGVVLATNGAAGTSANAQFNFGGGSIGGVTYSLDTIGQNQVSGSYAFNATSFTAPFNFDGAANLIFVGSAAAGTGDGSTVANRASVATADADTTSGRTFVLVNDGADIVTPAGYTLSDNQTLASFANGRTFTLTGAPGNVTGTNVPVGGTVSDTNVATLTSLAGPAVTLANNSVLADMIVSSGAGGGVSGSGVAAFTSTGLTVQNTPGPAISLTAMTGVSTLTNTGINNAAATGGGIALTNNTGATINFSGGLGIATASGTGFSATGGGTVNVAASTGAETVTTTAGQAIALSGIAANIGFDQISASGGATGIGLNAVSGSFGVSGTTNITNASTAGISIVGSSANATFGGLTTVNNAGTGNGIDLQTNTGIYNFAGVNVTVNGAGAFGIRAQTSGTVNITDPNGTNQVTSTNGTALYVNPTAIDMAFNAITAANGANGIYLDGASGFLTVSGPVGITATTAYGIDIRNATAALTASFNGVTTIDNTAGGGISITGNAATTAVNFTGGLNVDTTSGTGLNVNGAGAVTVSGGPNTIDSTAGTTFASAGGSATISVNAALTGTAGRLIDIQNRTGGTVTLSGTLNSTGTGILVQNNTGGTINFSGSSKVLDTGANIAVSLANNTGTTINFSNGGLDIDTTLGTGFAVFGGGTVNVTTNGGSANTITSTGAGSRTFVNDGTGGNATIAIDAALTGSRRLVDIQNRTGGSVTLSGNLSNTGAIATGILVQNNSGGTIDFSGAAKTLSTGANAAVTLTNNTGTTINFSNGGLALQTSTGTAFAVTGGGTVNVTQDGGSVNVINSNSGIAFSSNGGGGTIAIDADLNSFRRLADIQNRTGGSVTLSGNILNQSGAATGILVQGNSAGTIDFSGSSKVMNLSTGSVTAVTLTNNTGATVNFSNGGLDVRTNVANAFVVTGGGTVNVTTNGGSANTIISGSGTTLVNDGTGGSATIAIDAALTGTGRLVDIQNRTGGTVTLSGNLNSTGSGILVANNSGGTINFSGATKTLNTGGNTAVTLTTNAGSTVNFSGGGLNIDTTSGTGLSASGGGTLTIAATAGDESITATAGQAININGLTTDIALDQLSSTGSASTGVTLQNLAAGSLFTVSGTTTVNNATGNGIALTGNAATVTFGTTNVATTGGHAIALNGNSGPVAFGATTITGQGTNGIDFAGSNGTVFFDATSITFAGAKTGVDYTGATLNSAIGFASLNITGNGTAGSKGIDFTGQTTTQSVYTIGSGSISGVAVGVDLTNANITGLFRYGDGSAPTASTITATTPIVITGLNGSNGTYNFLDVNLVGDTSSLSASVYYVNAAGTGTGTAANPGSLAGAMASSARVIALVDTQAGGGSFDTINVAAPAQGSGTTLTLDANQRLVSFRNSDSLTLAGVGAPGNVLLTGITSGQINNPNPGNGAPLLTTSAGAATVTLASGNLLTGLTVTNAGGNPVLSGSNINALTISGSTLTGGSHGLQATDLLGTTAAGTASVIDAVTISGATLGGVAVSNSTATNSGNTNATLQDRLTIQNGTTISGVNATIGSAGVFATTSGSGNLRVVIDGSGSANVLSNNAIGVFGQPTAGLMTVDIAGNTITPQNVAGGPYGMRFFTTGSAVLNASITGNTIAPVNAGANRIQGIEFDSRSSGNTTLTIANNIITMPTLGGRGITVEANSGNRTDATIRGNLVTNPGTDLASDFGIAVRSGSSGVGNTICLNIGSAAIPANQNTVNMSTSPTIAGVTLEMDTGNAFLLQGFGGDGTVAAQVTAFVDVQNTLNTGSELNPAFVNYTSGTCNTVP
jgi:hypothetical protein